MAKTNITQYSSTPSENTDIDDINIDELCPASNLNNALRSLLSHLKNVDTGSQALTALSVTGALSCGAFTSNGIDDNADAVAITIDSSENVGIGTSSPTGFSGYTSLDINNATNGALIDLSQGDSMKGRLIATASSMAIETASSVPIIFQPTGSESMRIDSSGRVAIGATSANGLLTLATANSNTPRINLQHPTNDADATIDTYYDGSGTYLTIGTNVYQASNAALTKFDSAKGAGLTYYDSSGLIVFYNGAGGSSIAERMRIGANGHLYATNNDGSLANLTLRNGSSSDSVDFVQCRDSGNNLELKIEGDGDVYNTNNTYGSLSDETFKENISNANSQWNDIKSVKVRNYSMIADGLDTANRIGVIAQELETAGMNGLVNQQEDGTKFVKYSVLYMKAVKALQEAMTRIETLETANTALEARITALENA